MENLEDRQRRFLHNFLENAARVLQSGFAYLFAHPSLVPLMDCEMQKIRAMERRQERSPADKAQYLQTLRHAYIEYIAKLTYYGLKHAKCNPKSFDHVTMLQSIFDEYEQLRKHCRQRKNKQETRCGAENQNKIYQQEHFSQQAQQQQIDQIWEKTLNEINELHKKIDALGVRMRRSELDSPCDVKASGDTLVKFNEYLEEKIRGLREVKKNKRQHHQRREKKKTETRRRAIVEDSDYNSSEVMLSFQNFEKPLTKGKARIGNVERHLVIPIEASEPPKIKPRFHIKKSPIDGSMQLDLKLKFDDGILFQDKFVNGICIQNALPVRNFRGR